MLFISIWIHASDSYSCFWTMQFIFEQKTQIKNKKNKKKQARPPLSVYEFIRIFKNCDWCWSLKLHSWLWIELDFVRSLIFVFFDRTRKDSFQFFFICYTWFFYVFPFFIKLWNNPYKSYCRMLLLVHSHFSWKIWKLVYKVVKIFSCFSLEISLLFQFKKGRFCLFQLGTIT